MEKVFEKRKEQGWKTGNQKDHQLKEDQVVKTDLKKKEQEQ